MHPTPQPARLAALPVVAPAVVLVVVVVLVPVVVPVVVMEAVFAVAASGLHLSQLPMQAKWQHCCC